MKLSGLLLHRQGRLGDGASERGEDKGETENGTDAMILYGCSFETLESNIPPLMKRPVTARIIAEKCRASRRERDDL
jgi:hypothetical protein